MGDVVGRIREKVYRGAHDRRVHAHVGGCRNILEDVKLKGVVDARDGVLQTIGERDGVLAEKIIVSGADDAVVGGTIVAGINIAVGAGAGAIQVPSTAGGRNVGITVQEVNGGVESAARLDRGQARRGRS